MYTWENQDFWRLRTDIFSGTVRVLKLLSEAKLGRKTFRKGFLRLPDDWLEPLVRYDPFRLK